MWKILQGTVNLLADEKGIMCILILSCATVAAILGKMDGNGFAAACSVIGTIYCWVNHKENIAETNAMAGRPANSGLNFAEIAAEVKKLL